MAARSAFSDSYAEARRKFLAAAREAGATLHEYRHPATGPQGEPLALDVAVIGRAQAPRVLLAGCGTHGIEGYSGSAAMTGWIAGGAPKRLPHDVAVVLLHANNPWGFAHKARVTEENVDLNRNFALHNGSYPPNPGYAELHAIVTPESWDDASVADVFRGLEAFRERVGEQAYSDAMNGGQYSHPDGIFFGGHRAQWSNHALFQAISTHAGHARHLAYVDFHTGIGAFAEHVYLCFHKPGSPAWERARAWWGERAVNRAGVTHKAVAAYQGLLVDAVEGLLPRAETASVAVEFGTRERREMQRSIMSERWRRVHGVKQPELARREHERFVEAFYPSEPRWRDAVLDQARDVLDRAVSGLAHA